MVFFGQVRLHHSPDQATSLQGDGGGHTLSPLEPDLRGRKDDVVQDNLDYMESNYQWMMKDCQQFEGEMRKDCSFRSEAWQKEQLQKVDSLKDYLSK